MLEVLVEVLVEVADIQVVLVGIIILEPVGVGVGVDRVQHWG
jgi:hypothetical protein